MEIEEAVAKIAQALGETEEVPLTQLKGVTQALGAEHVLELLQETQEIEDQGGMLVPDKSRRRTPGGVFFFLARRALTRDQKLLIFPQQHPKREAAPAAPRPRPRIIEVAPERGKAKRTKFKPPELDDAVARARVRRKVSQSLASLSSGDQYQLLLDMLAELVDQAGSGADSSPESSERAPAAPVRRSRKKA